MKINSSSIGMDSARSYKAVSYSYRRFELRDYSNVNSGLNNNTGGELLTDAENSEASKAETSKNEKSAKGNSYMPLDGITNLQEKMSRVRYNYKIRTEDTRDRETIRQESIKYIMELLFGRARERYRRWAEQNMSPSIGQNTGIGSYNTSEEQLNALFTDGEGLASRPADFSTVKVQSLNYTRAEYRYESEETSFSAQGIVRTADGREISFNIDVGMSREFESYYEQTTNLKVGLKDYVKMCDPLVINLEGNVAAVSDQKIRFDIDGDGELDTVGRLAKGSGYLALDKNNDGKINDGTELFGTASGDGFADLAEYDEDGNGWIDENDAVWDKLKVFCYDENGKESLYSLAQTGVGAICLSKVATDFTQKDEENQAQSAVRSTGIFLYENGKAGTIQHLDVAKYLQEA